MESKSREFQPQTWALILALSYRLQNLRLCQAAAESWLQIASLLWDETREKSRIGEFPRVRHWAESLFHHSRRCADRRSPTELCRIVGRRLAGRLGTVARTFEAAGNTNATSLEVIRHMQDTLGPGTDIHALRELCSVSLRKEGPCPQFFVNPWSDSKKHCIVLERWQERLAIDNFRIRPHFFWVRFSGCHQNALGHFHVGQIVQEQSAGKLRRTIEWDTQRNHNIDYPFWPHASSSLEFSASHRCAVHRTSDTVAWSDWPQILRQPARILLPEWHFTTGLFRTHDCNGKTAHHLEAQIEWTVNWNAKGA